MARTIFLGTPDFAVPILQALIDCPSVDVVGVVTQPDRPAGRGQRVIASAVKQHAEVLDLPILQPESLRDSTVIEHLRSWSPDIMVVAAFGQILRRPALEMTLHGCINVHASLLPRWRGAAPIQYAIRAGDRETGITIMKMDAGLDTGPILAQKAIPIDAEETGATLHDKLAVLGAQMLIGILPGYLSGDLVPRPQPEAGVTLAPSLKKSEGQIDWKQTSGDIDRLVRAFYPWPGTFTFWNGELLKIVKGSPCPGRNIGQPPGTVTLEENSLTVQTGKGVYKLKEVQPAGKKPMSDQAFLAGHPNVIGAMLGDSENDSG
ncbi:MAG: methionyl-tRNA formyltransferase [Anaerolineae bacterium]|nr:methionyl-tRNA formyltransferase [Anaerolineae bacterium]